MLHRTVIGGPHHPGNGGQDGANHKGRRNHKIGLHAHQGRHAGVLGRGPHGAAQTGAVHHPHQNRQRHRRQRQNQNLGGGNHRATHVVGHGGQQVGVRLEIGLPDDHGQRLQQDRHANGGDQRRQFGAVAQGAVSHFFDHKIEHRGHHAGHQHGAQQNQPAGRAGHAFLHQANDGPAGQGTHHQHLTMGKVDQVDDAVHHGVAQGHQGIHAAQYQPVDDLLDQGIHAFSSLFSCRIGFDRTTGAAL